MADKSYSVASADHSPRGGSDTEKAPGTEAFDAQYTTNGLQRKLKARHIQVIQPGHDFK